MRVTYTSPNRSHHYLYASALARAGCLHRFVCGFSRFSPRSPLPEAAGRLVRADHLQNLYLASLKLRLPLSLSEELACLSKIELDRLSERPALESDLFLFYSGAGLRTCMRLASTPTIRVVEAVNSHVRVQEKIMREEYERIGLPFRPFHPREVARRVREYELADAVLCPSQFVKDSFVSEGTPAGRVFVVPYGTSLQKDEAPPARDETFRVLYVGQISVRKGLRYLFEAFERLRHPKKELVIVGPRTQESGIDDVTPPAQTRFTGILKGEALARAYREASVFVLPTVEEGLALVIGEALSYGLPVIATVNSGGGELFEDGSEGFLVPIRSPESLAEKLQLLADTPEQRDRMSVAARNRSHQLRGWESAGHQLVKTLRSMTRKTE